MTDNPIRDNPIAIPSIQNIEAFTKRQKMDLTMDKRIGKNKYFNHKDGRRASSYKSISSIRNRNSASRKYIHALLQWILWRYSRSKLSWNTSNNKSTSETRITESEFAAASSHLAKPSLLRRIFWITTKLAVAQIWTNWKGDRR